MLIPVGLSYVDPTRVTCINAYEAMPAAGSLPAKPPQVIVSGQGIPGVVIDCEDYSQAIDLVDEIAAAVNDALKGGS